MTDWFVVYTTATGERLAREDLLEWGHLVFLPMETVKRRPARHKKDRKQRTYQRPLFPRYLFVGFPTDWHDFAGVRRSKRVQDFIRDAYGHPLQIRSAVVEAIMGDLSVNRAWEAAQKAKAEVERLKALQERATGIPVGATFTWQHGLFKGFEARVVEVARKTVKVAVDNGQGATLTLDVGLDKISEAGLFSQPEGDQQKQCAQLGSSSVGRPEDG